jgi:DNA-binding transcriptional MerR regulator
VQLAELAPLPPIPAKRYFTIGEVSDLCQVKAHVLRYWEQEFTQLRPVKRRGNRRYYQHHEVLLIRRIRELLYGQGFTIQGARQQLVGTPRGGDPAKTLPANAALVAASPAEGSGALPDLTPRPGTQPQGFSISPDVREALVAIRELLG